MEEDIKKKLCWSKCHPSTTTITFVHNLFFKYKIYYFRRRSYPANFDSEYKDKCVRFAVRSLGWVEISEEDLTPERSSKAVNKCIVDLSLGLNTIMDAVGRWGDVSFSLKIFHILVQIFLYSVSWTIRFMRLFEVEKRINFVISSKIFSELHNVSVRNENARK